MTTPVSFLVSEIYDLTRQAASRVVTHAAEGVGPVQATYGALVIGSMLNLGLLWYHRRHRYDRLAAGLLDNLADNGRLAMEFVCNGYTQAGELVQDRMELVSTPIDTVHDLVRSVVLWRSTDDGSELVCANPEPDNDRLPNLVVKNMDMENSPVPERRHRRLPRKRGSRLAYARCVVAEIKAKIGTPSDREANRQIIRRLAKGIMDVHGVRPTHQCSVMPLIIECVLTPGSDELEAIEFARSLAVTTRRGALPQHIC